MGGAVGYSTGEARHAVMMLGEEFGVHLPRGLTTFIATLGPLGPALEAAFPFLAIALGATLLIEHLVKMHEAGEKLTDDQMKFGTAVNNAFNALETKLIQAQIKSDELRNDHLGALTLQLELINHASMDELVKSFEEVARAGDVVMKELTSHWYTFGTGSDGASHALNEFQNQYAQLMSTHKDADAAKGSDLLAGTLKTAQEVLKAQQTIVANRDSGQGQTDESAAAERLLQIHHVSMTLTGDEVAAQQNLVGILSAQVSHQETIAALKKLEGDNAKKGESNTAAGQAAAAARESAESNLRISESVLASKKAQAEAQLTVTSGSLESRLAMETDFAGRDRDLKLVANQAEIAALDKSGKDYQNQLKALKDKMYEIEAAYYTKVTELTASSSVSVHQREITELESAEHQKIEATEKGTAERITAIDAAIKEEQSRNLQNTNFFRELLNQRVETVRQEAEEEAKAKDAAIKQEIAADEVAAKEKTRHSGAMNKIENPKSTDDAAAKKAELDREYADNHAELMKELADTQSMGQAKVAEARRINDQLAALDKKYQDQKAELAAQEAQTEKAAAMEVANAFGQSMLRVAEGHESMAKMAQGAFESIVSHSLQAALMEVAHEKTAQLAHAESAAAAAMHAMSSIPVIGPALGLVAGATTFAAAMAFEGGGVVPGVGRGDIVPAMLSPGEGIVPGGVMDGLSKLARSGGMAGGGTHYHVHGVHFAPTVHALDSDGVDEVLTKHQDQFQRHFENTLRKMNR